LPVTQAGHLKTRERRILRQAIAVQIDERGGAVFEGAVLGAERAAQREGRALAKTPGFARL
jgi:hypothetical protein